MGDTIFPVFIRAEFRDDDRGFPAFNRAVDSTTSQAQKQFSSAFDGISRQIERALGRPLTSAGALDLDVPGLRSSAEAAQLKAAALRQVAQASEIAAREAGDLSESTRLYVQAARAAAIEGEQAAQALRVEAAAAETLQSQLSRLGPLHRAAGVAAEAMGRAQFASARGAAANRQALVQAGQQIQDFTLQVAAGQSPILAFGQQMSQLGIVTATASGKLGALGRFLVGPWGLALTLGTAILSPMVARLDDAGEATDRLAAKAGSAASSMQSTLAGLATAFDPMLRAIDRVEARLTRFLDFATKDMQDDIALILRGVDLIGNAGLQARDLVTGGRSDTFNLAGEFRDGIRRDQAAQAAQRRLNAVDQRFQDRFGFGSGGLEGFLRQAPRASAASREDRGARSVADAAAKAARETRELDDALSRLRSTFDPAEAAAQRYAAAIADIARLERAGRITAGESAALNVAAGVRRFDEQRAAWEGQVRATMERLGPAWTEALSRPLTDSITDVGTLLEREFGRGAAAAGDQLRGAVLDAADIFAAIAGRRGGALVNAAANLSGTTPNRFVEQLGTAIFGPQAMTRLGTTIRDAFFGAQIGQAAGGLILGRSSDRTGEAIGGAVGQVLGKAGGPLAKGLTSIFKGLGDVAGPLGAIGGALIGGLIGGALRTTPRGSATIGGSGGSLQVASIRGTSARLRELAGSSADEAITTLDRIAEQLGATIDPSRGSVSIGSRNGRFRVDPSGQGRTKTSRGAIDFGEDSAAAIRAATLDLIRDGVLVGLRQGTQTLLQNAKDLEAGLDKALRFESVFTRLRAIEDPVGAAVEAVEREFTGLRRVFAEAGASAADYAKLERLYGLQRTEAIRQAGEAMTSTLRGLLDELQTGDNGLSLRDRLSNALETYNPLRAQLQAGTLRDFDAYAEAARTLLDIERQLGGSQQSYFDRLDELTGDSRTALRRQQDLIDAASAPANDNTRVVSAIDTMSDRLTTSISAEIGSRLDAVNRNIGQLASAVLAGGGGGRSLGEYRFVSNF